MKISEQQKEKFTKAKNLIGHECGFVIGKKSYRAIIIAVSLPGNECTAYPQGEINEHYKKEFATLYSADPYYFNLSIVGRLNFWSRRIDNLDLSNSNRTNIVDKYLNFESIEAARKIYHG